MIRLAVTGATGFVGSAVVRAAIGRGWQVTAFGRRPGSRYWDLTAGPLADPPQVDAVVHCAAVTDWGPAAPIRAATVDGTRAVAATFPLARLVQLSSASVYDPFTPSIDITEDAGPVNRYLTAYPAAKADAERALSTRPNTVILRPHAVYGPGDPTLLPRLLSAVRGRTLLMVGDGTARASLTGIDNLWTPCCWHVSLTHLLASTTLPMPRRSPSVRLCALCWRPADCRSGSGTYPSRWPARWRVLPRPAIGCSVGPKRHG